MAGGLVEVNGGRVWCEAAGDEGGPAVVMLHGHFVDSGQWDDQLPAFTAAGYRVVRYDARGFGRSDTPPAGTPFSFSDDLRALLDGLGIERAALVGCSGGGMTAIDLALEHPERVSALVLVGSGLPGYQFPEMPPKVRAMREARTRGDLDASVELVLQVWTDGERRHPDEVDAGARERLRDMTRRLWSRPPMNAADMRWADPPAATRLGEIHTPTLVVVGGEDVAFVREIADQLMREVPGARRLDIPDAGHHPNVEHPALFNEAVLSFLRSATSR
jgi:3-oxoadipate enol-lactonase